MKRIFAIPVAMLALSASATYMTAPAGDPEIVVPDSTGFTFTDIKVAKTTPVKDQNKSGTCWSFAGIGLIENEILRKGGPELDLSEMFVVHNCYNDKADKYVRTNGKINFAQGGALTDVLYVVDNYGLVPEEVYSGLEYGEDKHAHYEMFAGLDGYVNGVAKNPNKKLSTAWKKGFNAMLDAYLGELPETFTYNGKTYTPRSYADELGIKGDDFISVTSYNHHPYYKPFAIEIADNWLWGESMNVPLDEMMAIIDNALENGYSLAWAADVSEGGFKWRNGYALMPAAKDTGDMDNTELSRWVQLSDKDRENSRYDIKGPVKEITVTQESRQKDFDSQETTDDHGMVIVGYAEDQEGNRYYKVKNSWDTNQLYGGYIYVSVPFMMDKTISVLVNKDAVPKDIAKKFKK